MGSRQTFVPTSIEDWARSDLYHTSHLIPADPVLQAAKQKSNDNGLPDIAVSESQGKFLNLLARSLGVRRILEVGTLGGYARSLFHHRNKSSVMVQLFHYMSSSSIAR